MQTAKNLLEVKLMATANTGTMLKPVEDVLVTERKLIIISPVSSYF